MDNEEQAILIMVTSGGRDDSERLGEGLVVERLAASCSVVPTVHSFYYLDGLLQREHEAMLLVRTTRARSTAVKDYLREHHSYKLPEIFEVAVEGLSPEYLKWLVEQVAAPGSNPKLGP